MRSRRCASGRATFAFTEVRLGLAPAIISLTTLGRMTERAASRYYLTGETFGAPEAAGCGLITAAADDNLDAVLGAIVDALRSCSPQGLAETKPLTTRRARAAFAASADEVQALSARLFELRGGAGGHARVPAETAAPLGRRGMTTTEAREPQQDRSRATRARLLEAAITCLAELGWSASTVAVVAEHAGVSRGAAQHHFPTREALFTAALEQMTRERGEQLRREVAERPALDTAAIVTLVFDLFTGTLFRAALMLWVAAASEPQLRDQIVPLEARIGREIHHVVVDLLGMDEQVPGVRETVQATLDLARGLGLANLLTDDSARRAGIARQWAAMLDAGLR